MNSLVRASLESVKKVQYESSKFNFGNLSIATDEYGTEKRSFKIQFWKSQHRH